MSTRNFDSSQLTRQIKGRAIFTNGLLKTTAINAGLITNTTWTGGGQGSDNETAIAASPGGGVYVSEAQRLAIINSVGGGGGGPPGPPPPIVTYESAVGTPVSVPGSKTLPSGFVVPETYTWLTFIIVGGGGGGGASRPGSGAGSGAGGGGGSGARLVGKIAVIPGDAITITSVGSGGAGGVYNQPPKRGTNGNITQITIGSTIYQAYGGSGGYSSDNSISPSQGGAGGTALSPPAGATGAAGNGGTSGGTQDTRGFAAGGSGGASIFSIFGAGGSSPDLSDVSGYTGGNNGTNGYYRITLCQAEPPPILLYDYASNPIPAPFDVPTFVGLGYSRVSFLLAGGGGGGGFGDLGGGAGGGGSGALVYYARSLNGLGPFTVTQGIGGSQQTDGDPTTVDISSEIILSAGGGTKGENGTSSPGQGGAGGTYISLGIGQNGISGGTGDAFMNTAEGGLGGSSLYGSYGLGGKGGSGATGNGSNGTGGYYQVVIT